MNFRSSVIGLALVIASTGAVFGQAKYSAKRPTGLFDRVSHSQPAVQKKRTVIRKASHAHHGPDCGCEAPAPTPCTSCDRCQPCCRPCCLNVVRKVVTGVGDLLNCLLPCTPCGSCGPAPRCGCRSGSWSGYCNGCQHGTGAVEIHSESSNELVPPMPPPGSAYRIDKSRRAPWTAKKPSPYRSTSRKQTRKRGTPTPAQAPAPARKPTPTLKKVPRTVSNDRKPPVIRVSYSDSKLKQAAAPKLQVPTTKKKKSNSRLNFAVPVNPLR